MFSFKSSLTRDILNEIKEKNQQLIRPFLDSMEEQGFKIKCLLDLQVQQSLIIEDTLQKCVDFQNTQNRHNQLIIEEQNQKIEMLERKINSFLLNQENV